jgi:hypothetical protein
MTPRNLGGQRAGGPAATALQAAAKAGKLNPDWRYAAESVKGTHSFLDADRIWSAQRYLYVTASWRYHEELVYGT